jgi:antitoxin component YwqK of YwqJK toxin-antitoxin module
MNRKLHITFLSIFLTVIAFGQIDTLLKQTNPIRQSFYNEGSPKTTCVYNKTLKTWSCTDYYINGKILSNYYCDSNSCFPNGLKQTYGLYGELVYVVNRKDELLHGPFVEYYCNGKIKRSGEFYNNFSVGTWFEYFENGKIKSKQSFRISKRDSLFNWYTKYPDSLRVFSIKIIFGAFNNLEPLPPVKICNSEDESIQYSSTDEFYGYEGIKTGKWLYYDKKGNLVKTKVYK